MEVLEGRVLLAADVYTWNPQAGNTAANLSQNWQLNGVQQGAGANLPGKNSTDVVAFNGGLSNAPIEWNQSFNFSTMSLGLTGGRNAAYTGLQTIDTAVVVELSDADGSWSLNSSTGSNLNLNFGNVSSIFRIDGTATINNMTLAGNQRGSLIIHGGTTTIAQPGGYKDTIGANVQIDTNGTLDDQGNNALVFSNNNVPIKVSGTMLVFYGNGIKLLDGSGFTYDYVDVNGETLKYLGKGGAPDTFSNVSVIVENGGIFSLYSAANQPSGAQLIVTGAAPQTNNVSVYMTGSSEILLSEAAILECDYDYYQDGGELATSDTTEGAPLDFGGSSWYEGSP